MIELRFVHHDVEIAGRTLVGVMSHLVAMETGDTGVFYTIGACDGNCVGCGWG